MKLNHSFILVLVAIITTSVSARCIIPVDAEAFSGDSITIYAQVSTPPNVSQLNSLQEPTKHKPERESKQRQPAENNISSGQTQLPQSSKIIPPLRENKPSEQPEPLLLTKGSETPQSLGIQQSTPWSRSDLLTLLGIVLGIVSALIVGYWGSLLFLKDIKRQIRMDIEQSFEILPWRITREEKREQNSHKNNFYTGNTGPDPSIYIGLNLDAERPYVAEIMKQIEEKSTKDWFHISIYGNRKQGKTIFMARLAFNISSRKTLRKKYHVFWCKNGSNTPFRSNLMGGRYSDVPLFVDYRKYFASRKFFIFPKPLIIFIDDLFRPEILESPEIIQQSSIQIFLRELMRKRINVITSSSSPDITIEETHLLPKLKLERSDVECILCKLLHQGIISKEFSDTFKSTFVERSLYRKQLFAFLSSLLAESGREEIFKTAFMKDFERHFANLSDQGKSALKMIAICQIVEAHLPEPILQEAFPESFSSFKSSLCNLARRDVDSRKEFDCGTYVYHMGGPFLARWILKKKFNIRDSVALASGYSMLFNHIISSKSFSSEIQKAEYIRLILNRLAKRWYYPIFNFPGRPLAMYLFESSKSFLEPYLNNLTDTDSLVVWASTMNNIGEEEKARAFYLKAVEWIQVPIEPATAENMKMPVSLAMGLTDMPNRSIKERAIPLFKKIVEKYVKEKSAPLLIKRVIHKLAETLDDLGQCENALETIENLQPDIPLDALLWQKKGDILERLERLPEARDCLKQSMESARSTALQNHKTLLNCLQHYVVFLLNHRNLAREFNEKPEVYLKVAERLCKDKRVEGYETVLNAWAKCKQNEGNILEAKNLYTECISYCRQEGIIHSYSWNDYARFLITHGSQFNEKSYDNWLGEAENFCWQVINDAETETVSKRMSYHIVGSLVGLSAYTSLEGKQRPAFSEGISILQSAFASPEPERNDDDQKNFQDVITHRILKDIYLRWSDTKELLPETRKELIRKADFHFQKAFLGLPRPNLNSSEVIEHALETQTAYGGFKWRRQEDLNAADVHYKEAIEKLEKINYRWSSAYTLYEFYAIFLFETKGKDALTDIVKLQWKALELIPESKLQKRSEILYNIGHNLRSIVKNELNSFTVKELAEKMDEVIKTFARSLELKPENEKAAKEIARSFLDSGGEILFKICTKGRVLRVKDILWQVWDTCPVNVEALNGLLDIADSVIGPHLHDITCLNNLSNLINSKATADKKAADALHSVCNRRRNNQHSGKLTKMLFGT